MNPNLEGQYSFGRQTLDLKRTTGKNSVPLDKRNCSKIVQVGVWGNQMKSCPFRVMKSEEQGVWHGGREWLVLRLPLQILKGTHTGRRFQMYFQGVPGSHEGLDVHPRGPTQSWQARCPPMESHAGVRGQILIQDQTFHLHTPKASPVCPLRLQYWTLVWLPVLVFKAEQHSSGCGIGWEQKSDLRNNERKPQEKVNLEFHPQVLEDQKHWATSLATWCSATDLHSPSLSFIICKIEIIVLTPAPQLVWAQMFLSVKALRTVSDTNSRG